MKRIVFLTCAALSLAACAQPDVVTPGQPPASDACGASQWQVLVGQPGKALNGLTLPAPHRVIPFGSAVTMDYSPDRLNVELDRAGRVVAVACY
ncbi:MAG: I78 family peptidase inhibitor [Paracoccus sp. (in: a-proteobacteria)]|uniref:I78 family peptidase inhibitor n=1 Tax=Paracoccus sp. TaxID=267 RepID=UPI0026DF5E2A|nr:I78 family peptidase inhibitor [Paracoccus sp. (in: a-proteobacteria)]MDO5621682.1 I78 family peptidase inhibitor [Paracoccus sp. (in: a-proteobacteria)]